MIVRFGAGGSVWEILKSRLPEDELCQLENEEAESHANVFPTWDRLSFEGFDPPMKPFGTPQATGRIISTWRTSSGRNEISGCFAIRCCLWSLLALSSSSSVTSIGSITNQLE
jgi:hypothetical protein